MPQPKKSRPPQGGEIRALESADLDPTYQLDQVCFPPGIAFEREVFEYCLQSPDCLALGVKNAAGKLVGFIIIQAKGKTTAQIVTIDVEPAHRRQGIADRLLAAALEILARNEIRRVYLQVAVDNQPGQTLYRKWGFTAKQTLKDYYLPGMDALMMARELKPDRS